MAIEFNSSELREIQDALADAITRMCDVGQTKQELEYNSLANAWAARKKIVSELLPGPLPDWVATLERQVADAIAAPKISPKECGD